MSSNKPKKELNNFVGDEEALIKSWILAGAGMTNFSQE